jgi:hypothetical protein
VDDDETEEQLICDSDSNCYTDDEASGIYDRTVKMRRMRNS